MPLINYRDHLQAAAGRCRYAAPWGRWAECEPRCIRPGAVRRCARPIRRRPRRPVPTARQTRLPQNRRRRRCGRHRGERPSTARRCTHSIKQMWDCLPIVENLATPGPTPARTGFCLLQGCRAVPDIRRREACPPARRRWTRFSPRCRSCRSRRRIVAGFLKRDKQRCRCSTIRGCVPSRLPVAARCARRDSAGSASRP